MITCSQTIISTEPCFKELGGQNDNEKQIGIGDAGKVEAKKNINFGLQNGYLFVGNFF